MIRRTLVTALVLLSAVQLLAQGTKRHPIIDSRMTKAEAFEGLDPKCPEEVRKRQKLITLKYYSSDGKIHQGQYRKPVRPALIGFNSAPRGCSSMVEL